MNIDDLESSKTVSVKTRQIVNIGLQLLALTLLLVWCFQILAPFFAPVIWAAIIAVTLYPLQQRLKKALNGKNTLSAVIITVVSLVILILIGGYLGIKTGNEIKSVVTSYNEGTLKIPPPPAKVKDWPLVGSKLYQAWAQLNENVEIFIQKYPDQIKAIGSYGIHLLTSTGKALLIFAFAIVISGVFLIYSEKSALFASNVFNRLLGSKDFDMAAISAVTIRNVVRGILGVASIQSVLAGAGFFVAGIPYAGIWTMICLILAIVQIGILPVTLGVLIYIWTNGTTTTAILLTIWMIPVGILDNVLKPLMMGKGAPVPMLIIFLGSLGGFMYSGFVGLFTGAVILSLGYRLFDVWLKDVEIK